jgi:REP element-mobilizing transposase RayT
MPSSRQPSGSRALRRGRRSEPGGIYLVTTTTRSREPVFLDDRHARAAAAVITDSKSLGDSRLLAWVLMPDHLHLLLQIGALESMPRVVGRIKSRSATAVKRASVRDTPVWYPGYHDRAIRRQDDIRRAARYIVANPVRAGLVQRCEAYPFWDAIWLPSRRGVRPSPLPQGQERGVAVVGADLAATD